MLKKLMTRRGETLTGTPWEVYPRPQMKRDSYINLNGEWEFCAGKPEFSGQTIQVPFCPESVLSGVEQHFPEGTDLWYRRTVAVPEDWKKTVVRVHFGAVDQVCDVYVDGGEAGHHEGGYEAFSVDIRPEGDAFELTVRCRDDLNDQSFPYGKQVQKRGGMWYTPVSGIWQTVWMESLPENHIEKLNIESRGCGVTISVEPKLDGKVTVEGLGEYRLVDGSVTIRPENPRLWSPEEPNLYDFTVECGEDKVESYFAIRCLEVKKVGAWPRLCLNGKPYFFHGLLDQGYWPDGLLTPAAPECYADDILAMKRLGFNTLRKHIKVEPEEFYYQCDKLGMIVFQDMVNNGDYNFLRDTALPTIGIQKLDDRKLHRQEGVRNRFYEGAEAAVKQLKNHPSICYWTIFNEGWGQFDSDNVYDWFRKLDDTRFIDSTSGWFRREKSDVDSRHVYFRKVKLEGDGQKPLVLSEFGGKTWKADGHVFNPDKTYGYGGCRTREELNEALVKLYRDEVLPCVKKGLCAAVYTQVSDVEDEINGLLTYDRKVEKADPEGMLEAAAQLQRAVSEN